MESKWYGAKSIAYIWDDDAHTQVLNNSNNNKKKTYIGTIIPFHVILFCLFFFTGGFDQMGIHDAEKALRLLLPAQLDTIRAYKLNAIIKF